MSRVTRPTAQDVRLAFLTTALGGLLFTFDLPLLRLSEAEQWTMIFSRGIFIFTAVSLMWLASRVITESERPSSMAARDCSSASPA